MSRKKTVNPVFVSNDSVGGLPESDAIKKVNSKKGFIKGDSIPPEQPTEDTPKTTPARVRGSDSTSESSETIPVSALPTDEDGVSVNQETLELLMDKAANKTARKYEAKVAELQKQVDATQQELLKKEEEFRNNEAKLREQVEAEKKQKDKLTAFFAQWDSGSGDDIVQGSAPRPISGGGNPYIAPLSMRGGISGRDAVREYERIANECNKNGAQVTTDTGFYIQKDSRHSDLFFVKNRDALRDGMDELARKHGLLQGRVSRYTGKDAPTTFTTLPVVLREYLSQVVRIEHSARFVLWQFVNRNINVGISPNQTCLVPRVKHLNLGTTSADWLLTPGTPTVATTQPLTGNSISVVIREYGMGKNATVEPVAIADIVMQTTLLDLESLIRDRVGYNYHSFEDLLIFELLLSSTATVYNSRGGVALTAGGVSAGTATAPSGVATLDFLSSLRAYMNNEKIPPMPDGSFVFAGTPEAIAQLENDQRIHHQYTQPSDIVTLNNMFASKTRNEYMGRMTGYKGNICGFHIFEGTSFSNGIPGDPGVQTETLGGTAVTTRSSFAMGADAIGAAESLPMELRESDDTNFGRIRSLIWKTHLGMTGLDIDPSRTLLPTEVARPVGAEEQLRVLKVNTSTVKV